MNLKAGSQSLVDINTKEIAAVCASVTEGLAAARKIFIAHAREKLQQQFSPQKQENELTWQHLERAREEGQAL